MLIISILNELRIDKTCLEIMSFGRNPNMPGMINYDSDDPDYVFPYPIVQLSKDTAKQLHDLNLDFMI